LDRLASVIMSFVRFVWRLSIWEELNLVS